MAPSQIRQVYIDAVIVWTLYSFLTILNVWYLFARAIKLSQTRFHIFMCLLLQISFICYVAEFALIILQGNVTLIVLCYNFYYALNSIAHGIFVMKYWVLSRKILQVTSGRIDHNLHRKEVAIYAILILVILTTVAAHITLTLEEIRTREWGNRIFKFFLSLPPIMIVLIFGHALYSLREHVGTEFTISKTQIAI